MKFLFLVGDAEAQRGLNVALGCNVNKGCLNSHLRPVRPALVLLYLEMDMSGASGRLWRSVGGGKGRRATHSGHNTDHGHSEKKHITTRGDKDF